MNQSWEELTRETVNMDNGLADVILMGKIMSDEVEVSTNSRR